MPSRVSSKSSLSPSSGQGSSAIDLGKDSGVDMGSKSQVSSTTGGIGVTQEVANVGGISVTGGVSVDISPIGLDVSGDSEKGEISIAASAEIPGGILGVGGGVTINTSTGQIEGGSIGGEVAGIGINISKSSEGVGIGISLQIPFSPISIELGFEFPNEKEENKPTPTTPAQPDIPPPGVAMPAPSAPDLLCSTYFLSWKNTQILKRDYYNNTDPVKGTTKLYQGDGVTTLEQRLREAYPWMAAMSDEEIHQMFATPIANTTVRFTQQSRPVRYYFYRIGNGISSSGVEFVEIYASDGSVPSGATNMTITGSWHDILTGPRVLLNKVNLKEVYYAREQLGWDSASNIPIWGEWQYAGEFENILKCADKAAPSAPIFPPPPNPPPRKEMDECCRESTQMLRELMKVLEVRSVLKGKMQIPGELIEIPEEGKTLLPEKLQTYPQMVNAILLAVNRHGIDAPITVEIEDTDKTTAGSQEAVYTYNSPGVAMQAALEMLHELKAAGNARLSIQIGIAFAVTRTLKIVSGVSESIREIIKMLGMPFRYKPTKMLLEFNLAGIKKGYGENSKAKEFSEMSKEELENIIPTLLEGSECDIPVPKFSVSESDDIRQMLAKLTIRKEK